MTRYVGLDVHKQQVTVAAVREDQEEAFPPVTLTVPKFFTWATHYLQADDQIALESSTNAWHYYDNLQPLVANVHVANSRKIRLITSSPKKTDRHDARVLAKLLAANLLPDVWVPPAAVRELRSLTAHRQRLVRERTTARNRLHSILHRHNITCPAGNLFNPENDSWWYDLPVSPVECLQIRHEKQRIEQLDKMITETDSELSLLSVSDTWINSTTLLLQITGIGMISAMTILGAVGEIERFPTPKQLVGYAGLGARVYASANTVKTGSITKQGRRDLRRIMIECAWMAVRWSSHWKQQYHQLCKRMVKTKAITVIARKLLVSIWHILTKQTVDRFTDQESIACSFMTWVTKYRLATRLGVRRIEFVRERLKQLGVYQQLPYMRYGGRTYPISG